MNQKEREKLEQLSRYLMNTFVSDDAKIQVALDDINGLLAKPKKILCGMCLKNEAETTLLRQGDEKQLKLCKGCHDNIKWNLITNNYWRKK